jgi:transposase
MQGINHYQPQLFVYVNLEALIPKHHILRKIDKVFDLAFVRKLTSQYYCHNNGRPSIDPELFFRMVMVGFLFGIKHDRKLCEEITCNIAYRWYCKLNLDDPVPDHSSLSKIRDRYGAVVFEKFFDQVVNICKANGLVKGESVITDSSLVEANASLDSMKAKDQEQALEESNAFQNRKKTDKMPQVKLSNKSHISNTDPESSLAKKEGKPRGLRYKIHSSIDADSRVILDSNITTGACHDTVVYLERLKYIQNKYHLNIKEVIADRGYGAIENIKSLNSQRIVTYIPLFSSRSGSAEPKLKAMGFYYDKDNNLYICPNGKKMQSRKHGDILGYRLPGNICKTCPQIHSCIAYDKNKNHSLVYRNPNQEFFERELKRMKEPIFNDKLKERMWKIEGIFAEAKNNHLLSRARYRGLIKVQIQAHMISTIQNLKRLIAYTLNVLPILGLCAIEFIGIFTIRPQKHKKSCFL